MKRVYAATLIFSAWLCGQALAATNDVTLALVDSNEAFALKLYKEAAKGGGNLILCPLSISVALSLVSAGAAGETREEMLRTLEFNPSVPDCHRSFAALLPIIDQSASRSGVTLKIRTAIWLDEAAQLKPSFSSLAAGTYFAKVGKADFARNSYGALSQINDWVRASTDGRIPQMLSARDVSADTRLVIANAAFFKGTWLHRFKRSDTCMAPFFVSPEKSVSALTMKTTARIPYGEEESLTLVQLPYIHGNFSMYILLPKEKDGLPKLEASLSTRELESMVLRLRPDDVDILIPKFKFTGALPLQGLLSRMGMAKAFDRLQADFGNLADTKLRIGQMAHQAGLEVNEEGTTAWAATHVSMMTEGIEHHPEFRADHPFLFLIVEQITGSIIFMGRLEDPSAGETSK